MKKRMILLLVVLILMLGGCKNGANKATMEQEANKTSAIAKEKRALVRQTRFGKVKGYHEGKAAIWKGIPYGSDTAGEARWKAPADPQKWENELDATKSGDLAIQVIDGKTIGSENALNLDIYRPKNANEELPVMVFIHGGNNQSGKASEISGKSFVEKHDAIIVSVNYRLGVLGFNPLPALKTGTPEENSGNFALLDLAKSFDWLHDNIAEFGGDKNNITVAGFSAGGRDVMAMLISPLFKDKFAKAISFSGGMTLADEATSQQTFAEAIAPLVVEDQLKADFESAKNWLLSPDSQVKEYLYQLDAERLVSLMGNASIRMAVFPHLYKDGVVIPEAGFDTKEYNAVPLLMLTGEQEFSIFSRFDPYFAAYLQNGEIETNPEIASQYAFVNQYGGQLYSLLNVAEPAEKMQTVYSAPIYATQILYGNNKEIVGDKMAAFGAFHGVFVPLLDIESKNYAPLVGNAYEQKGVKELAEMFQAYLFNFLVAGNPNSDELPEWNAWELEGNNLLFLDATKTTASAKMGRLDYDYATVLANIESDQTVTQEQKNELLTKVLNGRWFSQQLDQDAKALMKN